MSRPDACPFCGSTRAPSLIDASEVLAGVLEGDGLLAVVCCAQLGGCGTSSGSHATPEAALAAWNVRQPAPSPSLEEQAADAHDLARLDSDELDALRLAVGRERARRGWEPFPAFGELEGVTRG